MSWFFKDLTEQQCGFGVVDELGNSIARGLTRDQALLIATTPDLWDAANNFLVAAREFGELSIMDVTEADVDKIQDADDKLITILKKSES